MQHSEADGQEEFKAVDGSGLPVNERQKKAISFGPKPTGKLRRQDSVQCVKRRELSPKI